jgi:caffeoyl-CoA O-methyltransferase
MSRKTINLTDELYEYLLSVSVREPDLLKKLRDETDQLEEARMQISPEQGQFMALLARLIGAKRTLDIGVFTGYSSLCLALALPDDGYLVACDVNKEWTDIAQRYWQEAGVTHKIDLRLAPAANTLEELIRDGQTGSFDFSFIDADKTGYDGYYEGCLTLLRPGGLIAIDNVLMHGLVLAPETLDGDVRTGAESMCALNEKIHTDERVDISLAPISDGLTLARKR